MKAIYYCILFALGFIALIGIFSEPEPALDTARWTTVFVVSKSVGFAAGYRVLSDGALGKRGKDTGIRR